MDFSNAVLTFFQQNAVEKPSLFPFPFGMHLALVCIGTAFFIYRFCVRKRPNQILMASAMIVSLAIWLSESRVLYYSIGAIELVLLIACFVTSLIFKAPDAEKAAEADESEDGREAAEEAPAENEED